MFYMLMIFMKFSFTSQTFSDFFFKIRIRIVTRIRISPWNSPLLLTKVMLYILKILTKFGAALQSFCENQNAWFYFVFQYQTYISYSEDTRQIFFGSANSFESYCVHSQNPRTYSQTDRQAKICLLVLCSKTYETRVFIKLYSRNDFLPA